MTQEIVILIKTKSKEKDLENIIQKIKTKFKVRVFDKKGINEKYPKYRVYTEWLPNGLSPTIQFNFCDVFQTYKLTDEITIEVSLENKQWSKFDEFMKFVVYLCEETNSSQFIGYMDYSDWVNIIGAAVNVQSISEFRRYLKNYSKLFKFNNIPFELDLKQIVENHAIENEKIENFRIYYLLPKKGNNPTIFSGTPPDFYNQFKGDSK